MTKKYLKIHLGKFNNPTRDVRELLAAKEVGFEIYVLSGDLLSKDEDKLETYKNQFGFNIYKLEVKKIKSINIINRIRYYIKWIKLARKINADVISGHDIYALTMSYLATLFIKKSKKPILIYDSHEFEIGRNAKRGKFEHFIILKLERFLSRRCKVNIMVNDSIANEVQRVHKLKEKPLSVRSIPNYWEIDKEIIKTRREEILTKLNADENSFISIYHGGIMPHRGIEQAIEAILKTKDIIFVVMGKALSDNYLQEILNKVKENNFEDRFLLLPPMSPDRIWEYTGAADVGIMPIQLVVKNHEYSLPNKFFETIQSETPILTAKAIEQKKIIEKYGIGLTCDSSDIEDIKNKLEEMRNNKEKYKEYKENLKIAKKELCWENEKKIFIKAFEELYNDIR